MPAIIAIVGYTNSGKTTLVSRLVAALGARGLAVGTIKHTHHPADQAGKDTAAHLGAGAQTAVLHGPGFLTVYAGGEDDPETIARRHLGHLDVVLAEGYKGSRLLRIEIFRPDLAPAPVTADDALVLAFTGERPPGRGKVPFVDFDDTASMVEMIEARVAKSNDRDQARLYIDGRAVPMKFFVRNLIDHTIRGLVSSLKGTDHAGRIELILNPKKD